MAYILLTGATGLLGRYLIKDLLLADVPVAVLVRPTRRATARQRVETVMSYWDEQVGRPLPRPVVLEGDISEPDLGLDPRSMRWVAESCSAVLHNAASLTFQSTGPESEPYRSNVEGMRYVLELCRNAQIRKFHHVSTAYVCGLRDGKILESELDVGQTLSNDYEISKVEAEKMVRSADFIDELTVYRPAIIIGDAQNGYTTTYHGFYAPLQVVHTMMQHLPANETGRVWASGRFPLSGHETKNLVPVDWVSAVMAHVVTHPEHHGKTYHLTPRHPVTARLLGDVLEQATGFYGVSLQGGGEQIPNLTEYEQLFCDLIKVYSSYWRDDPAFDTTNTETAAPHLPCPHVDRQLLLSMAAVAIGMNFGGPRSKPLDLPFDAQRVLEPMVDAMEQLGSEPPDAYTRLGLQITGPGGGQWHLLLRDETIVAAEIGLDPNSPPTYSLASDTFAALIRGEVGVERAFADGQLWVEPADSLSRDRLLEIFQVLADTSHARALLAN